MCQKLHFEVQKYAYKIAVANRNWEKMPNLGFDLVQKYVSYLQTKCPNLMPSESKEMNGVLSFIELDPCKVRYSLPNLEQKVGDEYFSQELVT